MHDQPLCEAGGFLCSGFTQIQMLGIVQTWITEAFDNLISNLFIL
jgi:hypothetical protein